MHIGHCHEIGGERVVVGLLKPRERERARLEFARYRVGGTRRLVRVEFTSLVFGRTVLVSLNNVRVGRLLSRCSECAHLLGGSCLCLCCAFATGSKRLLDGRDDL